MFEYYIWVVCFVTLYISIFWISITQFNDKPNQIPDKLPKITIAVPAYNEEKNIEETLNSLININYPKDKIEIIVVDDCSTDNTIQIVNSYIKKYDNIILLKHKKNMGDAAHSLNTALREATGDLFARVDADSIVSSDSMIKIVSYFFDKEVGGVVSPILLRTENTLIEKIQRFEYILTNFIRNLMAKLNVLHYTTGVLTVYRTELIKKIGYFKEDNLTEDFEIAMRINRNGYKLKFDPSNITYTYVPNTFGKFWKQRIRWYRGFLSNSWNYRNMIFNKKYGLLGIFQTPLNLLFLLILFISTLILFYQLFKITYDFFIWLITVKWDIFSVVSIPNLKDFILALNVKVMFPILITMILAIYTYLKAHKASKEHWKYPFTTLIYLFLYPFIVTFQWVYSALLELLRVKRKW